MKKIYQNRIFWAFFLSLMAVGLNAQTTLPYVKVDGTGWTPVTLNANKVGDWNITGNGLYVSAVKAAGNSVNRSSQHWAFSPSIQLKNVSNKLEFIDKKGGAANDEPGSSFSILIAPATAGTDYTQYVTIREWNTLQTTLTQQTVDLTPWSGQAVRLAFLRTNEGGASWTIEDLKVVGSDLLDANNFRVTAITASQIDLAWDAQPAGFKYLLVESSVGAVDFNPANGTVYTAGTTVGNGTVLLADAITQYQHTGLASFTTKFYRLWVYDPTTLEYSMGEPATYATTIGESTFFYEDFEGTTDRGTSSSWVSGKGYTWTLSSHNFWSADNWLMNGLETSYRGNRSAHIVQQGSTTPTYAGNYGGVLTTTFSTDITIPLDYKSAELNFYWKNGGKQGYDYGLVRVNGTDVTPQLYDQFTWKNQIIDLSDYIGQTITLQFYWQNTAAYVGVHDPGFCVDDVMINGKSVARPANFAAAVVNSSLVNLSWDLNTDNNRVIVAYSPTGVFGSLNDGEGYETGDLIPAGGQIIYKGDATSYSHAITAGNKAYYRIWSVSDGDANTYSTALSAETVLPSTLPFEDDFEGEFNWNTISSLYNNWYKGRATSSSGLYSAYVSKDGGFTTSFNGTWTNVNTVLELPVNLAGFASINLGFKYKIDGDLNNTYGFVQIESGANTQKLNGTNYANKTTWQTVSGLTTSNTACFTTASKLRFYMDTDGSTDSQLGFAVDDVVLTGVLNPVTAISAANYGGLKNTITWTNAASNDPSLEVVILAYTGVATPGDLESSVSLTSGTTYFVGDIISDGKVVYIGTGNEFVDEPVMGGESYNYLVFQKNGLTYSTGKVTTESVITPENVEFFEDFEEVTKASLNGWNLNSGTSFWTFGQPANLATDDKVAFISIDDINAGYTRTNWSNFTYTLSKSGTINKNLENISLFFDYYLNVIYGPKNNDAKDLASITISGTYIQDVTLDNTNGLSNNATWQQDKEIPIVFDTPVPAEIEEVDITVSFSFYIDDSNNTTGLGFAIDNISVRGTFDKDSRINQVSSSNISISSLTDIQAEETEVFRFSLQDMGGDYQATNVHQLSVTAQAGNTIADWRNAIAGADLYYDNGTTLELVTSGSVLTQSILFDQENMIAISEGTTENYVLKIWLNNHLDASVDNGVMVFGLNSTDIVAYNGSNFSNISSAANSGTNTITITATELQFSQHPSVVANLNTTLSTQPIVVATDANGNVDANFVSVISLASDPTGLAGTVTLAATAGTAEYTDLNFTAAGDFTITASATGLTPVSSDTIAVSNYTGLSLSGTSYILAFKYAGIESFTYNRGTNGYELLTDQEAYVTKGVAYQMSILVTVTAADASLNLVVMSDYGTGGSFEEVHNFGAVSTGENQLFTANVTIGESVTPGTYRLRVALVNNTSTPAKSEIEDYTLVLTKVQWTGLTTEWGARDNWSDKQIPGIGDDVYLPTHPRDGGFFPVISENITVQNVNIESGASITILPGRQLTIEGSLNNQGEVILRNTTAENGLASFMYNGTTAGRVELTLPAKQYFYISSPMADATFGNFDVTNADAWVYTYKGSYLRRGTADAATAPASLEGVSAYYNVATTTHKLNYPGTLNSGEVSRTYTSPGWYLFGNPYPSFINWQNDAGWSRNNIDATIWYRTKIGTEMVFITYNRSADPGSRASMYPTGIAPYAEESLALIPPLQSVWIKVASATTLSVNNTTRSHGLTGARLKSSSVKNNNIIRITASNYYTRDGAVINFSGNASESLDQYDSRKQFNSSVRVPEVYTRVGTVATAINGMSELGSTNRTIPLSVRNRIEGEVTLKFDLSLFEAGHSVELEDKVTGTRSNLRANADYTYTPAVLGEVHDRFVLHINQVTTSVVEPEATTQDNGITIKGFRGRAIVSIPLQLLNAQDAMIEVYTLEGQKLSEAKTFLSTTLVHLPAVAAPYMIRVTVGGETKTGKVLGKGN